MSNKKNKKTTPTVEKPSRRNHYVPVWYQKRFLFNTNDQLYYLDTQPRADHPPDEKIIKDEPTYALRISPKKCFRQKDLYTTTVLGRHNDEIERFLFGEIDTKGSEAINALVNKDYPKLSGLFTSVFDYLDAQKLRTPKGLDWVKSNYLYISHLELMKEMQHLRRMHCTMWVECVMEIVSAELADVKFIISDHPVTIYNPGFAPNSDLCKYPNDPSIAFKGSQTIFPLDLNHCFILTNLEYAHNPSEQACAEFRTNVRYFADTLCRFDTVIRKRNLDRREVAKINYIIKNRARKYIAAANEEWLIPEELIKCSWEDLKDALLPPKDELFHFGGEIYIGWKDGTSSYKDAYGRTYKRHKTQDELDKLSIRERNIVLANAALDIFGFSNGQEWNEIRRDLTEKQIADWHGVFASLWPPDTDVIDLLPKSDKTLRAFYWGIIDPRVTITNVVSYSLYADQILIINPLINNWCVNKKYSPVDSPKQFKHQTIKNLGLLFQLMPLIQSGIVEFIPNPLDFDKHLRLSTWQMGQERLRSWKPSEEDMKRYRPLFAQDYLHIALSMSPDSRKAFFKKIMPSISDYELDFILQEIRTDDPFAPLQDIEPGETGAQFNILSTGGNLEIALFISCVTGSYIYTDMKFRKREIRSTISDPSKRTFDPWRIFNETIRENQLELLWYADSQFIAKIHNEDIFNQTRDIFRKIYNTSKESSNIDVLSMMANSLAEEWRETHGKFCREWGRILKSISQQKPAAFESMPLSFSSKMHIDAPISGFGSNSVLRLMITQKDKDKFLNTLPMAIYFESAPEI